MFCRDVLIESRERTSFMSKELQIRNSTVDFLVFTRDAGEDGIEVRVQNGDVWLTQKAISQLFDVDRSVVTKHLSNIFKEGELDENSVCAKFAQTADDGKSWKNAPDGKIVKTDVSIAKNYLEKEELAELNEIVTMYLDYATRQARRHIPMTMEDWKTKLDAFLRFNDADALQDKGKVTAAIAKEFAESEFEKYRVIQDSLYESDFDKLMNDMEKNDAIH